MPEQQVTLQVFANTTPMENQVRNSAIGLEKFINNANKAGGGLLSPLGNISRNFEQFDKSLEAANSRVLAFGASAGIILGLQRSFADLIRTTIDVEKRFADINVILNLNRKELNAFGNEIFNIAKNTGQSFATVADATVELARQGLGLSESLERAKQGLILVRLSGLDAASSIKTITAAINGFERQLLSSRDVVAKIAAVDANFAVSAKDLAEALTRVGSTADSAGVNFEELLGIVTAVQQTTSRGGAVIGNALKSIFTKIQRPEVIEQLRELGVAIEQSQDGLEKLKNISAALEIASPGAKSIISELVGGVYQINIVNAALKDLSNQYNITARATELAANASDEAERRNAKLNETLATLSNRTLVNFQQVFSQFGKLTIGPGLERVLNGVNVLLEGAISKDSNSLGEILGRGILRGLGEAISGPGLALIAITISKLVSKLAVESGQGLKSILGLNETAKQRITIEQDVASVLRRQPELIALANSGLKGQQQALTQIRNELLSIQKLQRATTILSPQLFGSGRTRAVGHIPALQESMGAYAAGYTPGAVKELNIPNYGKVVYNDAERVRYFPGFAQPAIMPPASSRAGIKYREKFEQSHGFNPYANEGLVPNFAVSPWVRDTVRNARTSQLSEQLSSNLISILPKEDIAFAQKELLRRKSLKSYQAAQLDTHNNPLISGNETYVYRTVSKDEVRAILAGKTSGTLWQSNANNYRAWGDGIRLVAKINTKEMSPYIQQFGDNSGHFNLSHPLDKEIVDIIRSSDSRSILRGGLKLPHSSSGFSPYKNKGLIPNYSEYFQLMNHRYDVSKILEDVKKGKIKPELQNISVAQYAEGVLGLNRQKHNLDNLQDIHGSFFVGLNGPHLANISSDRLREPGLLTNLTLGKGKSKQTFGVAIDGNHRIAKAYLSGIDNLPINFITEKLSQKYKFSKGLVPNYALYGAEKFSPGMKYPTSDDINSFQASLHGYIFKDDAYGVNQVKIPADYFTNQQKYSIKYPKRVGIFKNDGLIPNYALNTKKYQYYFNQMPRTLSESMIDDWSGYGYWDRGGGFKSQAPFLFRGTNVDELRTLIEKGEFLSNWTGYDGRNRNRGTFATSSLSTAKRYANPILLGLRRKLPGIDLQNTIRHGMGDTALSVALKNPIKDSDLRMVFKVVRESMKYGSPFHIEPVSLQALPDLINPNLQISSGLIPNFARKFVPSVQLGKLLGRGSYKDIFEVASIQGDLLNPTRSNLNPKEIVAGITKSRNVKDFIKQEQLFKYGAPVPQIHGYEPVLTTTRRSDNLKIKDAALIEKITPFADRDIDDILYAAGLPKEKIWLAQENIARILTEYFKQKGYIDSAKKSWGRYSGDLVLRNLGVSNQFSKGNALNELGTIVQLTGGLGAGDVKYIDSIFELSGLKIADVGYLNPKKSNQGHVPNFASRFLPSKMQPIRLMDILHSGNFSPKQRQVMAYTADGLSVTEIASQLRMNPQEVEFIRKQMKETLASQFEAIKHGRMTLSQGLVPNYAISGRGISNQRIIDRLRQGADKGQYFSDFYDKYENQNPLKGVDRDLLNKIYAAISYRSSDNLVFKKSIDIFQGLKRGQSSFIEELKPLGLWQDRHQALMSALMGSGPSGKKTNVYYQALSGNRLAIPLDANFINTALDVSKSGRISSAFRERLTDLGTQTAGMLGIDPRALQAAVFAGRSKFKPSFSPFEAGFASLRNNGLIPNFNALFSAIGREAGSGVPLSQIRIGQSPQIASSVNPLGLGVYNLRDEPAGLSQGIRRAIGEGNNPKTYGVPNFAPQNPLEFQLGVPETQRKYVTEAFDKFAKEVNKGTYNFGQLSDKIKRFADIYQVSEEPLRQFFKRQLTPQDAKAIAKDTTALERKLAEKTDREIRERIKYSLPAQFQTLFAPKLLNAPPITSYSGQQQFLPGLSPNEEIFRQRALELQRQAQAEQQAAAEARRALVTARAKRIFGWQNRLGRRWNALDTTFRSPSLQNFGLMASFALPTLGGTLAESIGDETLTRRGLSQGVQSTTNIAGFASLGLPWGIKGVLAGGVFGLITEFPRVIKAATDVIPDLEKNIVKLTSNINSANDGFSSIIQTTEKISQYRRGELNLSPFQYASLSSNRDAQISKLATLFPKYAADIRIAGQSGNLNDIEQLTAKIVQQASQENQLVQIQRLGELVRPSNPVNRIFNRGFKQEDLDAYTSALLLQSSKDRNNQAQIPEFLLRNSRLIDQFDQSFGLFADVNKTQTYATDFEKRNLVSKTVAIDGVETRIESLSKPDSKTLNIIQNRIKGLQKTATDSIITTLTELQKAGGYEGIENEISKIQDLSKRGNFGDIVKLVSAFQEKLNTPQLRVALSQLGKNNKIDTDLTLLSRELDRFSINLDFLASKLSLLNQTELETLQRQSNRKISARQNIADIGAIRNQTNPFLALQIQTEAERLNAQDVYDTELINVDKTFVNRRQQNIIQAIDKFKDLYRNNSLNDKGGREISQQGYDNFIQQLIPSSLSEYFATSFETGITNLTEEQRGQFFDNARQLLSRTSEKLDTGKFGLGENTKLLREREKALEELIKAEELTGLEYSKAIQDAKEKLEDNRIKINQNLDKQRAQIIESLASTYADLIENSDALNNNAEQAYIEAAGRGFRGRRATRFINFRFQQRNAPLLQNEYKTGNISTPEYRRGLSNIADAELLESGELTGQRLGQLLGSGFGYNRRDYFADLKASALELGNTMRSSFSGAFQSFVDGSKTAEDAARQLGISIATNILNKVADIGFNSLISGLFTAGQNAFSSVAARNRGGFVGYNTGGMVYGGSGVNDDIPMMLNNGAFVIRKSSTNKYGKSMLDAINYGRGFANGGINQILTNEYRTIGSGENIRGEFNVDPRLSVIGQTDENNPANLLKFGREQDYINYLNIIENYRVAKKNFEAQKTQRLVGAYVSGLFNVAGAGLSRGNSNYQNYGQYSNPHNASYLTGRAFGGVIGRYAMGGSVDTIPALLTGGEYVMSPEAVNRMGVGFMNQLNAGQVSPRRYAMGGLVGKDISSVSPVQQNNSEWQQVNNSLLKLLKVNEEIRDINTGAKTKIDKGTDNNVATAVSSPQVNITINMMGEKTNSQTQGNNTETPDGQRIQEFAKLMESVALKTIIAEQRNGGLLENSRKR